MNNEMRLARVDLGEGWIDLGYGEPVVVQSILHKYIALTDGNIDLLDAVYQPPQGKKELVALLEKKYDAKVVVTNGAKHGIAAIMYALKKLGHQECVVPSPYWTSHPTLITDAGLRFGTLQDDLSTARAVMITSPNNPDGREATKAQFNDLTNRAKADNCILIHDAAYYTPIYMSNPKSAGKIGDAQIYSFSKMYGLSGIRIGYVVIHNLDLLPHVIEFVERSSSGVSTASQSVALAVENFFKGNPVLRKEFESKCRKAIAKSRKELGNLDPDVLEVMPCKSNSMFAWCKAGPKLDYKTAKVNLLPGDIFGKPGFIRINLAVDSDLISTAVERLNKGASNERSSRGSSDF